MSSHLDLDHLSESDNTWQKVVLENALDAVIGVNDRDLIVDWNRQAEVIFGWSREEAMGRRLKELIIPDELRAAHEAGMVRFLKTGVGPILNKRIEIKAQHKNGSHFLVELTVIPVRVHDSLFFYSFLRDISERKRLEAERIRMAESERLARKRLNLQYTIIAELAKAHSADGIISKVIHEVSEQLGWEVGAFWSVSAEQDRLILSEFWPFPSPSPPAFYEKSKPWVFRRDEGVLGQVWTSGAPAWSIDAAKDDRFLRTHLAAECGLRTGFWIPVSTAKKMHGVLEFLSRHPSLPDDDLLQTMSALGKQIAQFLEKMEYEESVKKSEAKYRYLFESNPQPMWVFDQTTLKFLDVNEAAIQRYGYQREEFLGMTALELRPESERTRFLQIMKEVGTFSAHQGEVFKHVKKGGEVIDVEVVSHALEVEGRPARLVLAVDVTDRLRAEGDRARLLSDLTTAKEAAEIASEAKSNFLANMSHEIRTPLGAILGFTELMEAPDLTEAERKKSIGTILRNGEQLAKVINEILDISKVESNRLETELLHFSLPDLIEDVTSLLQIQAQEKGLDLKVRFDGAIPESIKSDPTRLRQILINVVGNAIKFTEKGKVELVIKGLGCERGSASCRLVLTIRDSGIGISTDQQNRLFQPFTQADSSMTRRFGGTGLGLVLSKHLAKALGGDLVLIRSEPNIGSEFQVTIVAKDPVFDRHPSTTRSLAAVEPAPLRTKEPPHQQRLNGVQVLVVDDAPDNRTLVARFLKQENAEVACAANGAEGFEMALRSHFDVVLMDLQMPTMDGFEALANLRRHHYDKPVIALTAHAMKGDKEQCLAAGFNDHLVKPVDRTALIEAVYHYSSLSHHLE